MRYRRIHPRMPAPPRPQRTAPHVRTRTSLTSFARLPALPASHPCSDRYSPSDVESPRLGQWPLCGRWATVATLLGHWRRPHGVPIVESEATMNCLWLTLADPDPATNGQLIYSKGLIEGALQAGASLHVIGLARPESRKAPVTRPGLTWQLFERQSLPSWRRVLSGLPEIALRVASPAAHAAVERALRRDWDVVVFDSICSGWALGALLR